MDKKHDSAGSKGRDTRGITLLELVMVLAVVAIVAATAVPELAGLIAARRLEGAASNLAADLQFVRSEALARNRSLRLSVRSGVDATCWIVHTGAAGDCDCAAAAGIVCAPGASAIRSVVLPASEHVSITANVASIVFDPLHGTSTPTGTLRIVDGRGRSIRHVVNIVGRVRSCSPAGEVAGYPAC
jgi:type IV fimbrial biogenesis protein FimT